MNEKETLIIRLIKIGSYTEVNKWLESLECNHGVLSDDFLKDPYVIRYINWHIPKNNPISLWYFLQTNSIDRVETKIKEIMSDYKKQRSLGVKLPPKELLSLPLIRGVYLSGKEELITIFKKYLPVPPISLFKEGEVPRVVEAHHSMIAQSLSKMQAKEDKIIPFTRKWRALQRQKEERARLASDRFQNPDALIHEASQPYQPRCKAMLAERILFQSKKVKLFDTVKHLTSLEYIKTIFDDALYGQRTLIGLMLPFREASLSIFDQYQGDSNVICCGPFKIDPQAMKPKTLEINFDLHKMSQGNPLFFYKQRDFGFDEKRKRILIKGDSLEDEDDNSFYFSHTNPPLPRSKPPQDPNYTYFYIYHKRDTIISKVPNCLLISYNMNDIQQILTLNFFRFIDAIEPRYKHIKDKIYNFLADLSDDGLFEFLQNIGKQVSDTCEVNIYGAHRIDFSTVTGLSIYQEAGKLSYSIDLKSLTNALERDEFSFLKEVQQYIPEVFHSYRFLDFLISHTPASALNSSRLLSVLRDSCVIPPWFQSIPKSVLPQEQPDSGYAISISQTKGTLFCRPTPTIATAITPGAREKASP